MVRRILVRKIALFYLLSVMVINTIMHAAVFDLIESSLTILNTCIEENKHAYIPRLFNKKLDVFFTDISTDEIIACMIQANRIDNNYLINGLAAVIVDRLYDEPNSKALRLAYLKNALTDQHYAFISKYLDFKEYKKITRACKTELSIADYLSQHDIPLEHLGNIGILRFDNKNLTSIYGIQDISLSDVGLIVLTNNCIVGDTVDPQFPTDPFQGLSNTYNLLANKNLIESLPTTFFKSTPLMQVVNLAKNRLSSIPNALTSYTDQIGILKLSYNMLSSIPDSDIMSIPLLEHLYLDNNLLTNLPSNLLTANPALNLFLNNNRFTTWPVTQLDNQIALIYLDLSYNSLIDFTPDSIIDGAEVALTGNLLTTSQQEFIQSIFPAVSFYF